MKVTKTKLHERQAFLAYAVMPARQVKLKLSITKFEISKSIVIARDRDAIWLATVLNHGDPVYHHYAVATDGKTALMYASERDKLTTN